MPAPKPLTQCDPPQLDWSRPGTPATTDFGDIYFSTDGGLEETRTVFLGGCGLPEAWQDKSVFTIGELGFGSGLNFLAAWQMWDATKPKGGRLHFVSIEKFPFDAAQLSQALSAWPELEPYSDQLIAAWPGRVRGYHRMHFGDVTLTLIHDDIAPALDSLSARVDAWFLDGFSPSKNPDMWTPEIMAKLPRLSAPDARLATFTVAGFVRQGLKGAGFEVNKRPGFGRKRDRLEARLPGAQSTAPAALQPLIIGAGIAGASLARAFLRRGITPKIISRGMAQAASANPAALIKPRLDLQDRPESRFFLSAYLYALREYHAAGAILQTGVTHLPKTAQELRRFEKLLAQAPLSEDHLYLENGALQLPQSLVIDPKVARDRFLGGAMVKQEDVSDIETIDHDGPIFIAAGFGVREIINSSTLPLRYSRGQLTWAKGEIERPLTYGGYALPHSGEILLGATHDRLDGSGPFALRTEDDAKNMAGYSAYVQKEVKPSERPSRASVRVTTTDTLPLIAELADQRWVLSGLGSRGFVFAPLLAEAMVSRICGEPDPVEQAVWARFDTR